jgi:hypothetical protein
MERMTYAGVVTFKGRLLRCQEKGFFGIPFKRLLGAGLSGRMITTITKMPFPDLSLLLGLVSAIAVLIYITPRGGIPRWQRVVFEWRWRLQVAGITAPQSVLGLLSASLQLSTVSLDIDGDMLFSMGDDTAPRILLTDWVSFGNPHSEGMEFVGAPLLARVELAAA